MLLIYMNKVKHHKIQAIVPTTVRGQKKFMVPLHHVLLSGPEGAKVADRLPWLPQGHWNYVESST